MKLYIGIITDKITSSSVCDRNIVFNHGAYTVERYNFNFKAYDDIQKSHITTVGPTSNIYNNCPTTTL